jgi:hypothetical protein
MAKIVTGINVAHQLLDGLMEDKEYHNRMTQRDIDFGLGAEDIGFKIERTSESEDMVRRVNIVHIDHSWNLDHPMVPKDVLFGSEESKSINDARIADSANAFRAIHGTTCLASLTVCSTALPLCDEEEKLWNLAPFAEVILVPVRETPIGGCQKDRADAVRQYLEYTKTAPVLAEKLAESISADDKSSPFYEAANPIARDVVQQYQDSIQITAALDEVIHLANANVLERGDVVLVTLHQQLGDDEGHLPIIHNPWVEERVAALTSQHGISVVIPAGNSGTDLNDIDTPRLGGKIENHMVDHEHALFRNYGVQCGAIIVGAHSENVNTAQINYGDCVDVYGRCRLTIPAPSSLEKGGELYEHWQGSTIASVVATALLANVQQIRFASPQTKLPLKPYEARAHLRQWRSRSFDGYECVDDLTGPPPDIRDWLFGTGFM